MPRQGTNPDLVASPRLKYVILQADLSSQNLPPIDTEAMALVISRHTKVAADAKHNLLV
jgi:hypothetical protein